jgi:hypothetical protein
MLSADAAGPSPRYATASSAPKATFVRPALLAARSPILVRLETSTPRRHAGKRCPMALRGIPLVLASDFEVQQAHRQKTDIERSSGSDLPNGG